MLLIVGLDLENRNTTEELIAFVTFRDEAFYCIAPVEYWIVEWWNGYVDLSKGSLEEQYFNYLKKFAVDYNELFKGYRKLYSKDDPFTLEENKPKIYIDFNQKFFRSFFYEQQLERRMIKGWTGEYGEIDIMIPKEMNYWKIE